MSTRRMNFINLCHAIELDAVFRSGYIYGIRDRPIPARIVVRKSSRPKRSTKETK